MIEFEHSFNVPHFFMFLISFLLFFSFFTAGFFSFQDKTGKMGRRNRVSRVDRKEADRLCQNVFQKNISRLHKMGREKASKNERKNWKKKKVKKDKKEKKKEKKTKTKKRNPNRNQKAHRIREIIYLATVSLNNSLHVFDPKFQIDARSTIKSTMIDATHL